MKRLFLSGSAGHARSDRAVPVAARWSRRREALHDERKARFIAAFLSGDRSDRRQLATFRRKNSRPKSLI